MEAISKTDERTWPQWLKNIMATEKRDGKTSFEFIGIKDGQYRKTVFGEREPFLDKLDRLLITAHAYDKRRNNHYTERTLLSEIEHYWDAGCEFNDYRKMLEETENPDTIRAVFGMTVWLQGKTYYKGIADLTAGKKKVRFYGKGL